jgi:broad specificity phosphatase PhoE
MLALQARVVRHLEQLGDPGGSIVIVSHAEPIRAALMHYLAIGLDDFHSIILDPASISTILFEGHRRCVSRLNGEVMA